MVRFWHVKCLCGSLDSLIRLSHAIFCCSKNATGSRRQGFSLLRIFLVSWPWISAAVEIIKKVPLTNLEKRVTGWQAKWNFFSLPWRTSEKFCAVSGLRNTEMFPFLRPKTIFKWLLCVSQTFSLKYFIFFIFLNSRMNMRRWWWWEADLPTLLTRPRRPPSLRCSRTGPWTRGRTSASPTRPTSRCRRSTDS